MSWEVYGHPLKSRMLLGTAQYRSLANLLRCIVASRVDVVTVSLKRSFSGERKKENNFWEALRGMGVRVLPNTAGCRSAEEAVQIALAARSVFLTDWIKLEVIGDDETLYPDSLETIRAAGMLTEQGFQVFPYCTSDLVMCQRLVDAGCEVLMPFASLIGSGAGIENREALRLLRSRFPNIPLIIDAGMGTPSDAVIAMEMGMDAVLLNSAVALAGHDDQMAQAFAEGIACGRLAFLAGRMPERTFSVASTSLPDTLFWMR